MGILDILKGKAEELRQRVAETGSNVQNQSGAESRDVGHTARETGHKGEDGEGRDTADREQAERRTREAAEDLRRGDTPGDPM